MSAEKKEYTYLNPSTLRDLADGCIERICKNEGEMWSPEELRQMVWSADMLLNMAWKLEND